MGRESIGDIGDEGSDGVGGEEVYKGKADSMLVSVSDSYSDDDSISVRDSRPSSSPAYTATDYCPKENVYYFDLRRSFYSK